MKTILGTHGGAVFSESETYRYVLWRDIGTPLFTFDVVQSIAFLGLNPSTADQNVNDPTITRCERRARSLDYERFYMVNLFGLRSTDPKALYTEPDPIGPGNDEALAKIISVADTVVLAWGVHGELRGRAREVLRMIPTNKRVCLGVTKDGHPRHPLYISNETQLEIYARDYCEGCGKLLPWASLAWSKYNGLYCAPCRIELAKGTAERGGAAEPGGGKIGGGAAAPAKFSAPRTPFDPALWTPCAPRRVPAGAPCARAPPRCPALPGVLTSSSSP
ncbi:MAG: DUF1643 domain-containing protein [Deltaproteobacteria bacterium]|nr:DUF1643 domain-containing protein [Deltaproteobacteria bacterium]